MKLVNVIRFEFVGLAVSGARYATKVALTRYRILLCVHGSGL